MAIKGQWVDGETKLIHDDTTLPKDSEWVDGESFLVSEYEAPSGGGSILPIIMQSLNQFNGGTILCDR